MTPTKAHLSYQLCDLEKIHLIALSLGFLMDKTDDDDDEIYFIEFFAEIVKKMPASCSAQSPTHIQ